MDELDNLEELPEENDTEEPITPEEPQPFDALKAELLSEFPQMTDAGTTRLIGFVHEAFLDRLNTDTLPDKWRNTFESRVIEAAQMAGIVQYEAYSENGLSVVLDRDSMLRGVTPVARVV